MPDRTDQLRPPAEERWAAELATLAGADAGVSRKFYGDDPLVDRAIVSLLGRQGLMLVGEPGTAKSMLSELLAAAISGTSNLTIQGSAGTTEDHIRYSWNYALLIAEGPSERALVPSPVYQAMARGAVVRFEEITRPRSNVGSTSRRSGRSPTAPSRPS